MSDIAKRVADKLRDVRTFVMDGDCHALAAFIEAAQACRMALYGECAGETTETDAYDAALRDLAQSMEVE